MNKQQIILVGLFMSIFILGVILLRDVLSFSSLEAYRSELLAFRDDNFVLMALSWPGPPGAAFDRRWALCPHACEKQR